jgi:DHA2 family multidrug resistance protein
LRDRHPLVDLKVFRFRTFTIGNILMTIVGFGLFGTSLIMPLFFQTVLGMTAYDTGMALLPGAIATAICMVVVGRLIVFVDPRLLTGIGIVLFAWSCWALGGLNEQAGIGDIFMPRLVQGFGMGFLFVPLTTVMLSAIPRNELAGATGVSLLLRQLGGSLGIAFLTTLLSRETAIAWNVLASGVVRSHGQSVGTLTQLVAMSSSVIAYDYLFRLSAIIFIVTLPLVYFLRPPRFVREAAAGGGPSGGLPAMALAE